MATRFDGFDWDRAKSDWKDRVRGFDFATASLVFDDPFYVEIVDDRRNYGEARFNSIGNVKPLGILIVTWTPRANLRRIISARFADTNELRIYADFRGAY